MEARPKQWPQATAELLPNLLFRLASQYPHLIFSEYPRTTDIADGHHKVTYGELANAVHAVAWWIEQNVGKPLKDDGSETLVYLGPNDLRYSILVLGSVMVGYKMLFPAPRYGAEAIVALISKANGSVILIPTSPFPVVSEVLVKRPMRTFDFPPVLHFLLSKPTPYPYTKTFETSKNEPLVCLHTSGTTGFPKPVIWTHDWVNSVAEGHYLPAPNGYKRLDDGISGPQKSVISLFPAFHASGIIGGLFLPLFLGTKWIHAPARMLPHEAVEAAVDVLDSLDEDARVDVLALPPPHVEYIGANPTLLDRVSKKVGTIMYSGGGISRGAGDAIVAKMSIVNQLASTELALWHALSELGGSDMKMAEEDWSYVHFQPALNIHFDPVTASTEGTLYQAILVKDQSEGAYVQPAFKIFPDVHEIALGDLFTRHPYNSNKWKHAGRSDDLLNFLTGETFHPGSAEQRISADPGVAEALIVGTRRPKASLIIRLNDGKTLEDVWTTIEEVNKDSTVYARVEKHMVLTATDPFPRTAKGSIQKKATIQLYNTQLDALYKQDGSYVPI